LNANVPEANFSRVRDTGIATTAEALCLALLTSNPPGLQLAALVYVNYSSLRHHELPGLACFLLALLLYEYRVPLQASRYLCFPADSVELAVSMKHTIQ
jgi:hypothetical protein